MKILFRLILTVAALLSVAYSATAQTATAPYKFDLGAGLGMSGYIGDDEHKKEFVTLVGKAPETKYYL